MNTKNSQILTLVGGCLLTFAVVGHGYVENSRNHLCSTGGNTGCGAVQYEPQSVEGPDRFPATGPQDGTLAAAGSSTWAPLNAAGSDRWQKNAISTGANTFHWRFTANHISRDFRYYITKANWNPDEPLSRDQLESTPFCEFDAGFAKPDFDTYHSCAVPARQGYHVILAVWDVGDTAASFYNAIDVQFGGDSDFEAGSGNNNDGDSSADGGDTTPPDDDSGSADDDALVDIGDIHPSMSLAVGDEVQLRLFSDNGELLGSSIRFTIPNEAAGERQQWPLEFATYINQYSLDVQAGMQDASGSIVPMRGHNNVFAAPSTGIVRTEVRIVTTPDEPTDSGDTPTYPEGLG